MEGDAKNDSANKIGNIPLWALRWMCLFYKSSDWEFVEGDVREYFELEKQKNGLRMAQLKLWWLAFCSVRHFQIQALEAHRFSFLSFANTWQLVKGFSRKSMGATIWTVASLVLAFTVCLVIFLMVRYEQGFDGHNTHGGRVYRLSMIYKGEDGLETPDAFSPPALGAAFKANYADVEKVARVEVTPGKTLVKREGAAFYEDGYCSVDPEFFQIFTVPFVQGSAQALSDPTGLVLTQSLKEKYFGKGNAIGEILSVSGPNGEEQKTVLGVIEDFPPQSHFHFSMLGRLAPPPWLEGAFDDTWDAFNWYTYVLMSPGVTKVEIDHKGDDLLKQHIPEFTPRCHAQPLFDIHLDASVKSAIEPGGNRLFINTLALAGIFLFVVSIFNFVNLVVMRMVTKLKFISVNKIHGATNFRMSLALMVELAMVVSGSVFLSLLLTFTSLPIVNDSFGLSLSWSVVTWGELQFVLTALVGFPLVVSIIPVIYFSKVRMAEGIKGRMTGAIKGVWIRKALVAFQLGVGIVLLTGVMLVSRQMNFIKYRDLGFNANEICVVSGLSESEDASTFRDRFHQIPEVTGVSVAGTMPGESNSFFLASTRNKQQKVMMDFTFVDTEYFSTMQMEVMEGRCFSKDFPEDAKNFSLVINQTAARQLGIAGHAVGAELTSDPTGKEGPFFSVVGVVKDFHFATLHQPIKPFLFAASRTGPNMVLRVKTTDYPQTLAKVQKAWQELEPEKPFNYYFLSDKLDSNYSRDWNFHRLFSFLTWVTLIIAGTGLYAVASYFVDRRQKEMVIRKVMGASSFNIFAHINGEYLLMTVLAFAVAAPFSIAVMTRWLNGFAYRTSIQLTDFVSALVFMLVLAIVVLLNKTWHIIGIQPAKVLKDD